MKFAAILLPLLLVACGGTMNGVVRGTGEPVQFSYEQGSFSDTYSAVINGEVFNGRAVMQGSTSVMGNSFGSAYSGGASAFGSAGAYATSYTGQFVATLLGSRGSRLYCQMRYADNGGFTTAGGIGVCQHSDGRIIDLYW